MRSGCGGMKMIDIIKNIYNLTGYINGLTYAKDDDAAGMIRDSCDTLEVCLDELVERLKKEGMV